MSDLALIGIASTLSRLTMAVGSMALPWGKRGGCHALGKPLAPAALKANVKPAPSCWLAIVSQTPFYFAGL